MEVEIGWSAEVASGVWDRANVRYDETDWDSLVYEHNLQGLDIPLNLKFQVMEIDAQRMIAAHVATGHPDLRSSARQRLAELTERKNVILDKVRKLPMK